MAQGPMAIALQTWSSLNQRLAGRSHLLLHGGKKEKTQKPGERVRHCSHRPCSSQSLALLSLGQPLCADRPLLQTLLARRPLHTRLWLLYNLMPTSCQETAVARGQGNSESLGVEQARGVRL